VQADEAEGLIERLRSTQIQQREEATQALRKLGSRAKSALLKVVSDTDLEVATTAKLLLARLRAIDQLTPALLRAVPGLENRLLDGSDRDWTQAFLDLSALLHDPQRVGDPLHPEDLEPLVKRAFQGAVLPKERREVCSVIAGRKLRWPSSEALQWAMSVSLHSTEDFQGVSLPEALKRLLWRYRIGFAMDTATLPDPWKDLVAAKFSDVSLDAALGIILNTRHLGYVPFEGMILVTGRPDATPWDEDPYAKTPIESARISQLLEVLVRRDGFNGELASRELQSQGPKALWPLLKSVRKMSGMEAEKCRSTATGLLNDDTIRWVAEAKPTTALSRGDLETTVSGDRPSATLGEWVKETGLEVDLRVDPQARRHLVFDRVTKGCLLKILTRPYGLDFQLKGNIVVIDTAEHLREAPGR
jgi:hypothetical protein